MELIASMLIAFLVGTAITLAAIAWMILIARQRGRL